MVLTLLAAGLLTLADRAGLLVHAGDDLTRYHNQVFKVVRVLDGDTLVVDASDGSKGQTTVRLWGVDTPEASREDPPRPAEPYADEATALTRELTEGERVELVLEPHRLRGDYGRLLAYVVLPDQQILNEALLEAGLARADGRWSHTYVDYYEELQARAKRNQRGMWAGQGR